MEMFTENEKKKQNVHRKMLKNMLMQTAAQKVCPQCNRLLEGVSHRDAAISSTLCLNTSYWLWLEKRSLS